MTSLQKSCGSVTWQTSLLIIALRRNMNLESVDNARESNNVCSQEKKVTLAFSFLDFMSLFPFH